MPGFSSIVVYSGLDVLQESILIYCVYVMAHSVVSDTLNLSEVLFWHTIYSRSMDAAADHPPASGLKNTSCLCSCPPPSTL